jgi:hypothetical protein
MEILNLLEACSIMRDALAFRMALVSNMEAMSSLMPLRNCLALLRARLPWLRITRVTFYIMLVILSIGLGEFMLGNLIMFHIMLLCIKMRLLALGNQPMLNCLKRKLLLHQMSLMFHLRPLMLLMCSLTKSGKVVVKYVGGKHKDSKTCVWVPKVLVSNVKGPKTVWVPKNKA